MKPYKHIGYNDRLRIEVMRNKLKYSVKVIADTLDIHYTNIYKELKRGRYERMVKYSGWDYRPTVMYSAEIAQRDYEEKATHKGASLKIGKDFKLVAYIEDKMLVHKYSPGAVLGEIKAKEIPFDTTISKTTLYRYIDENLFLNLTNKDLPQGKRSGRKYGRVRRISYKHMENKSIEQRPAVNRDAFGHWEMDTVVGRAQGKSTCLLVLTERMTRLEVIVKIKQRSSACVVKAIDQLEKRHKKYFPQVFKTITVDNGSEFMDCEGIERDGRTQVYYCHPFSSWERGSNENANKLIRRFIPKGTRLDKYTKAEIQRIEHWMNNYPRKILNYKTSVDVFNDEIQKLIA